MLNLERLMNKLILLVMLVFGLSLTAQAKDLAIYQTALRIAQDEVQAIEVERNADSQRVLATEKEIERLKKQLGEERAKAAQSEKRYAEAKKKQDKAQAAFDEAWKR